MTAALPNPFEYETPRFELDVDALMEEIEPPPIFLSAPSSEFLADAPDEPDRGLQAILKVIFGI
jgi:hypothetical protein